MVPRMVAPMRGAIEDGVQDVPNICSILAAGNLFTGAGFPARWFCGSWSAWLGWTHIVADLVIFGAYAAVAAILFFRSRHLLVPGWQLLAAAFIACGLGHLWEVVVMWHPWYYFTGTWKAALAIISGYTAFRIRAIAANLASSDQVLRAELALEEAAREAITAQSLLTGVLEHSTDAMIMVDTTDKIVRMNRQAELILGWQESEVVGRSKHSLIHHTDQYGNNIPAEACQICRSARTGEHLQRSLERFYTRNGVALWVSYSANPIIVDGILLGTMVLFHDHSEEIAEKSKLAAKVSQLQVLLRQHEHRSDWGDDEQKLRMTLAELAGRLSTIDLGLAGSGGHDSTSTAGKASKGQ